MDGSKGHISSDIEKSASEFKVTTQLISIM